MREKKQIQIYFMRQSETMKMFIFFYFKKREENSESQISCD